MYDSFFKRLIDFVVAIVGLLVLSPLLCAVAAIIHVTDGAPVLFKQQRVGRQRKLFSIYKFRTMSVNLVSAKGSFDAGDTSRVTRFGSVLRKCKLDEIPQLFNVLKGDMSLVGPRPEIVKWTQIYTEDWDIVLTVRPGITDWASILYRHEEEVLSGSSDPTSIYRDDILPRKLEQYKNYVSDIRFGKDLEILIKTFWSLGKRAS